MEKIAQKQSGDGGPAVPIEDFGEDQIASACNPTAPT
jgi:hypothetical protein